LIHRERQGWPVVRAIGARLIEEFAALDLERRR
jgi:hypothetical protein